jgi:hypothetical protein
MLCVQMKTKLLQVRQKHRFLPVWQGAAENDSKCVFLFIGKMITAKNLIQRLRSKPLGGQFKLGRAPLQCR